MQVLFLTTEFPWPAQSGGTVRTLSQLRLIASLPQVEAITLLSVTETEVAETACRALEQAVGKLRVVPPVFHPVHLFDHPARLPRVLARRALGRPYLAAKWDSAALRAQLRRMLRSLAPQVVYIDHLGMANYLPELRRLAPRAHVVLDQHNVESDFFAQFARERRGLTRAMARLEHRAALGFERRTLRAVDAVSAISADDQARFRELAGVAAQVVPVVVEPEAAAAPARARPAAPRFGYVGNLRWRPNALGLDWLCQQVWPLVLARLPDASLEIAGIGLKRAADGALEVPAAWRVEGVETVGFLERLEPLYDRSRALLAPIVGGSGVRMKLLEALRAGMPVVTTPDGAAGLPLEHQRHALIADTPEAFADCVQRLAEEDGLCDQLREGGFELLRRHHSLEAAQRTMSALLAARPQGVTCDLLGVTGTPASVTPRSSVVLGRRSEA